MIVLCPTCNGKGKIPDPQYNGISMCYSGPNGESVPHTWCRTCGGAGWVQREAAKAAGGKQ